MPLCNALKPSSSKKQKMDHGDSSRPAKQSRRINSYFLTQYPTQYPISLNTKDSTGHSASLNDEQKRVLEMVADEGQNVFFTGAVGMWFIRTHSPLISLLFILTYSTFFYQPGTRKLLLLWAIIATLKKKHAKKPDVVSVTASTEMAASNIGGAFFLLQPTGTLCLRHFLQFITLWANPNFVALCLQVWQSILGEWSRQVKMTSISRSSAYRGVNLHSISGGKLKSWLSMRVSTSIPNPI